MNTTAFLTMPVAVVLALVLVACDQNEASAGKMPEAGHVEAAGHDEDIVKLSSEEAVRAGLKTDRLASRTEAETLSVTATIRAAQDGVARVAPRVEGRITRVTARLGDAVKAGQVLATLDSVTLGKASSARQQAATSHRVAQADLERTRSLAADEIVPRRELVRAQGEADKAAAELRAADDELRLLGASGGGASFGVKTPISGVVIERKATVGELAGPAESMFTVADLSVLWVEAHLNEALLGQVRVGATATVTVQAYPGETFSGRVTYIGSVLDRETRAIPARIEVGNRDGRLKPEMFATATIETGSRRGDVLAVPNAAIVLMQGQPTIFVREGEGFEARPVELGDKLGTRTVIRSGAATGDEVVTAGAYALKARKLKSQIGDAH